ncbi:MAG TPA: hypothetical protein VHU80_25415 [Polyangiaceae bacterium]|jgi:hypothetical protein|nr:hypothetical protein [Polyangiaceae bacterium]
MSTPAEAHGKIALALWAPAAVGMGVFAANVAAVHRFTVDDAYITLRYSRNVARGIGAVYNATGARAEGYTSFLWMVLLALTHVLRQNALAVAKALGVLFAVGTCGLTAAWTFAEMRPSRARVLASSAAVAGYAVLPRTAIHAVSGMETALFTTLLTAALFAATRLARDGARWALPFSLVALAAALTRPEASLAIGVAGLSAVALQPRAERMRTFITMLFVCAAPLVGYELWRLHYYGLPLPLPFYVKLASADAVPGAEPVVSWLGSELRFVVPLVFFLKSPERHLRPALFSVLSLVLFFFLPQHLMGYDSRYLSPVDPAMCVFFGLGVGRLFSSDVAAFASTRAAFARRFVRVAPAASTLVAFVVPAAVSVAETPSVFRDRLDYADGLAAAHERLGRDLASVRAKNPRLAISDAGAVPYLSGWWTLDLIGLNDAQIAVTGSREPAQVLARGPDLLVLISTERDRFVPYDWNAFERPLFDAATAAGFARVDLRRFASDYWLWVLARPGFERRTGADRLSFIERSETETGGPRPR